MTLDKLEAALEKLKVGPKNVITINADERVAHGLVISVMDEARKAGVVAFGFATNRK
jgi:biopolymer transport protein ExbD